MNEIPMISALKASDPTSGGSEGRASTLVVGDLKVWEASGQPLPDIADYRFADISQIEPGFIRDVAPSIIFSSLVARDFDAIEIARRLGNMEYDGCYRVLTNGIPDVNLIIREVYSIAPGLDFDIVDLTQLFPDF